MLSISLSTIIKVHACNRAFLQVYHGLMELGCRQTFDTYTPDGKVGKTVTGPNMHIEYPISFLVPMVNGQDCRFMIKILYIHGDSILRWDQVQDLDRFLDELDETMIYELEHSLAGYCETSKSIIGLKYEHTARNWREERFSAKSNTIIYSRSESTVTFDDAWYLFWQIINKTAQKHCQGAVLHDGKVL